MTTRQMHRSESGQVGGIEVLPFGVLIFAVGTLLLANAWAIVDAKSAVTSAAREAGRTYVESTGPADGAAAADRAGRAVIESHGHHVDRFTLQATGSDFGRCQRTVFRASYRVPALKVPLVGGYGDGLAVTSTHTELVDPWRSGIEGSGCAG